MGNSDDFRFQSHQLLLELDAATSHMMMLVSARQASGYAWDEAGKRQKLAYDTWAHFLYAPVPAIDPMPSLVGRATGSFGPLAD